MSYSYSPVIWIVLLLLDIYFWIVIAAVVSSWLVAFGVINMHNQFVRQLIMALRAMTEPLFRLVRKVIPIMGGLDLSPMVVIVIIWALQYAISYYAVQYRL